MRRHTTKKQPAKTKDPEPPTLQNRIQAVINKTPLANFGKVHARYTDEQENECTIRANSPADACRIIEGLRSAGFSANINPWDAKTVYAK